MNRRLKLRIAISLIFVMASYSYCASQSSAPVLSVGLAEFGWTPSRDVTTPSEYEWGIDARRIVFDHSGHIYIGLNVPPTDQLLKQGQPRLTFRVIRLNCQTGLAEDIFDYPAYTGRRNSIYVSGKDTLLVAVDDTLQILSHHPVNKNMQDKAKSYFIMQSASGNTLLVEQSGFKNRTILDPDTLTLRKQCFDDVGAPIESITDSSEFSVKETSYVPEVTILKGYFCQKLSAMTQVAKRVPHIEAINDSNTLW